ncbi:MAG TPA: alpha/beta fold hydrolase [Devosiaceae bacterium]
MTPLVLLPGMMCDARLFAPQVAALGRHNPIHLAPVAFGDTMADIASQVLEHAPPRFALAGLSMGGIVAMEVYRRAPGRVERIALLDTNPMAELPEVRARRRPQIEKVMAGGLAEVMLEQHIPRYLVEGPNAAEIRDLCLEMALGLGPDVFVRQSIALRDRPDYQDVLRDISVPALVLCGRHERLCPLERHELMHRLIAGSRLAIVEDAAHLPTLEQPHATTAELAAWLEQ